MAIETLELESQALLVRLSRSQETGMMAPVCEQACPLTPIWTLWPRAEDFGFSRQAALAAIALPPGAPLGWFAANLSSPP